MSYKSPVPDTRRRKEPPQNRNSASPSQTNGGEWDEKNKQVVAMVKFLFSNHVSLSSESSQMDYMSQFNEKAKVMANMSKEVTTNQIRNTLSYLQSVQSTVRKNNDAGTEATQAKLLKLLQLWIYAEYKKLDKKGGERNWVNQLITESLDYLTGGGDQIQNGQTIAGDLRKLDMFVQAVVAYKK